MNINFQISIEHFYNLVLHKAVQNSSLKFSKAKLPTVDEIRSSAKSIDDSIKKKQKEAAAATATASAASNPIDPTKKTENKSDKKPDSKSEKKTEHKNERKKKRDKSIPRPLMAAPDLTRHPT